MTEKQTGITKEDMLALIEAMRLPVVTERDKRELAEQQENRKHSVEQLKDQDASREWLHTHCTHRRRNNEPRTGHINNHPKSGGEFLVCQACQVVIRGDDGKGPRYENGTVFDTNLFNSLLVDQSPVMW